MAGFNLGTAEGRITVDASQAIGEVDRFSNTMAGLDSKVGAGQGLGSFHQSTLSLAQGMQNLGRVGVGLGASLTAPFVLAGKAALDFESSMAGVNAVMDLTGAQFEQLGQLAQQLGQDTIFTGNEAAQGIETLGKAGISFEDIVGGAAKAAADLAAAGGTDIPAAAEVMAAAMAAFNIAGEDSVQVADALAGAANASLSDVNQLALGLSQVGGIAAAANMDLTETVATMAIMADNGIRGSDAATSMKTAILALLSPTDKAAEKMAGMGIELKDTEGNFVGLKGASQEFFDVWKDSGQTMSEFLEPLTDVLGRDAVRAILFGMQAIQDGIDGTGKSWEDYEAAISESGAAAEFAEKRMDSTAGAIERLRGSLGTLAERAGLPLVEAIRGPIEALDGFVDALANIPEPILSGIAAAGALAAVLTTLGGAFLLVGGYVLEAVARLSAAGVTMGSVASTLGTIAVVAGVAIAALTIGTLAVQNNWFGIRDAINSVGDALTQFGGDVGKGIEAAQQSGRDMSALEEGIYGVGSALTKTGIPVLRQFGRFLITNVVEAIGQARDVFERWTDEGVSPLVAGLKSASRFVDIFAGIGRGDNLVDFLDESADKLRIFGDTFRDTVSAMEGAGATRLGSILAGLSFAWETAFGDDRISQGLLTAAEVVETLSNTFAAATEEGFNPAAAALQAVGVAIAGVLGHEGLGQLFFDAAAAAQEFGDTFREVEGIARNTEGITGLSAMLLGLGAALYEVAGIDIREPIIHASSAINEMAREFNAAVAEGLTPFEAALRGIDAGLDTLLSPEWEDRLTGISEAFQTVANTVGGVLGAGLDRVGRLFSEIGTAISQGDFSGVLTAFQSLATDIQAELGKIVEEARTIDLGSVVVSIRDWVIEQGSNLLDRIKDALGFGGTPQAGLGGTGAGGMIVDIPSITANIVDFLITSAVDLGEKIKSFFGFGTAAPAGGRPGGAAGATGTGAVIDVPAITVNIRDFAQGEIADLWGTIEEWLGYGSATPQAGLGGTGTQSITIESIAVDVADWVVNVAAPNFQEAAGQAGSFKDSLLDWLNDQIVLPSISELPTLEADAQELGTTLGQSLIDLIGQGFQQAFGGGGGGAPGSREAMFGLGNAEAGLMQTIDTAFAGLLKGVALAVTEHFGADSVSTLIETGDFQPLFDDIIVKLQEAGREFVADLAEIPQNLGADIQAALSAIFNINEWLQSAPPQGGRPGGAAGATSTIADLSGFEAMVNGIVSGIGDIIGQIPGKIAAELGVHGNPFDEVGKQIDIWLDEAFGAGATGVTDAPAVEGAVVETIGGYQAPIESGIDKGTASLADSARAKMASGNIIGAVPDAIGAGLDAIFRSPLVTGAQSAPSSSEMADNFFSPVANNIPAAVDEGMGTIGEGIQSEIAGSEIGVNIGDEIDNVLAANLGGVTLAEFSRQIGVKIAEAIQAGLTGGDQLAIPGSTGTQTTATIGQSIADSLSSSITDADFSAVGSAIQAKISTSLITGLSGDATEGVAGAAGGIGQSVANAIAGQIGRADFAAVGQAIQAKIGSSLITGVQEGGGETGGAVAGAAGGLGASIAAALAGSIGQADFAAVGAAIQAKIGAAISAGTAAAPAGGRPGGAAGATGSLGSSIASQIVADIQGADFTAAGDAVAAGIAGALGPNTAIITDALNTVISSAVTAATGAAQAAQPVGAALAQAVGNGIAATAGFVVTQAQSMMQQALTTAQGLAPSAQVAGSAFGQAVGGGVTATTGYVTGTVNSMVQAAISAGVSTAAGAVEIGNMVATHAGEGAASSNALNGAVETMVGAAISAGVSAAGAATEIGAAISSGAAAGVITNALDEAVRTMVRSGIDAGLAEANAASPSKEMMQLGEWMSEGAVIGVESGTADMSRAGADLARSAMTTFERVANSGNQLQEMIDRLGDMPGFEDFAAAMSGLSSSIAEESQRTEDRLREMIDKLRQRLRDGARDAGEDAARVGKSVSDGIATAAEGADTSGLRGSKKTAGSIVGDLKGVGDDVEQLRYYIDRLGDMPGFEDFAAAMGGLLDNIDNARTGAIDSARGLFKDFENQIKEARKSVKDTSKDIGTAVSEGVSEGVASGTATATDSTQQLIDSITGSLNANLTRLPEMAGAIGDSVGTEIADGLTEAEPVVEEAALGLGYGVVDGINRVEPEVIDHAGSMVDDAVTAMGTAATEGSDFARQVGELVSNTFGEGFATGGDPQAAINLVREFHTGLTNAVNSLLPQAQQSGSSIGDAFTTGVDQTDPTSTGASLPTEAARGMNAGVPAATGTATDAGSRIGNALTDGINEACAPVNQGAQSLTDDCVPKGIQAGENAAAGTAHDAGEHISESLVDGLDVKKKDVEREFGKAGDLFGKGMASGIGETTNTNVDAAKNVAQKAGQVDGRSQGVNVGESLGAGIAQGIENYIPEIIEAAKKAIREAEEAAKEEGKSKSPSEVFADIGRDLSLGLAIGIERGIKPVEDAMRNVIGVSEAALSGAGVQAATRAFDLNMDRYSSRVEDAIYAVDRSLGENRLPRSIAQMSDPNAIRRGVGRDSLSQAQTTVNHYSIEGIEVTEGSPEAIAVATLVNNSRRLSAQYRKR